MSKAVLLSIKPKYCELIASGKKTIEIRKTRPKLDTPFKVYIYATKSGDRLVLKNDKVLEISKAITGKVIGEFVCNWVKEYESEFVDNECREAIASIDRDEDGDITGFYEWSNEMNIPYIETNFFKKCCVGYEDLKNYIGLGFTTFYGWHISDLVIYDKPKLLHHFFKPCDGCDKIGTKRCTEELTDCRAKVITRSPQSWCYVESEVAE